MRQTLDSAVAERVQECFRLILLAQISSQRNHTAVLPLIRVEQDWPESNFPTLIVMT